MNIRLILKLNLTLLLLASPLFFMGQCIPNIGTDVYSSKSSICDRTGAIVSFQTKSFTGVPNWFYRLNDTAQWKTLEQLPNILFYSEADSSGFVWTVPSGFGGQFIDVKADIFLASTVSTCAGGWAFGNPKRITIGVSPSTGQVIGKSLVCSSASGISYTVAYKSTSFYNWQLPPGAAIESGTGTNSIVVKFGNSSGIVTVYETSQFNCRGNNSNYSVTVNSPPITSSITGPATICQYATAVGFEIIPRSGSNYDWIFPSEANIQHRPNPNTIRVNFNDYSGYGNVAVVETDMYGCVGDTVKLPVNVVAKNIRVTNAFTPNGDGVNDFWEITPLSQFPDNEVIVYNSFGHEVYRSKNYQNNFIADGLANEVYYYVVKLNDPYNCNKEALSGPLLIKK